MFGHPTGGGGHVTQQFIGGPTPGNGGWGGPYPFGRQGGPMQKGRQTGAKFGRQVRESVTMYRSRGPQPY
jgi:hypothetical protein